MSGYYNRWLSSSGSPKRTACALLNKGGSSCTMVHSGGWAWYVTLTQQRMEKTITNTPESQYLWVNSPYWLNNQAIWRTWPAREMSGPFKWYHLVQLAFWFQQILVIHLEKRRKDHNQMLTHHIITCITISVAYVYRYTNVANVVLCLMDIVDLLLPVSSSPNLHRHNHVLILARIILDCENPSLPWSRNCLQHYLWRLRGDVVHCPPCHVLAAVLRHLQGRSRAQYHVVWMLFWYHKRIAHRHCRPP